MKNKIWHVIGVMSGTSLDGVDLVYVEFTKDKAYSFDVLRKKALSYSEIWKNKLQNAFNISEDELVKLDVDYGRFLGKITHDFILENNIKKVDFIASHGHTIFHKPEENYTLQIGSGTEISSVTNLKVICDFRTQDVKLGGQGAPLVPIGDMLLFDKYDFCLNLGGFANISFQKNDKREAFDICPVNIVMNHYTRKINLEYDDKGIMASQGTLQNDLLIELNNLPFYIDDKPKSLGYEFVVETILPMVDKYNLSLKDMLRTFIEHAAFQISEVISRNITAMAKNKNSSVLITGGGAYNDFLIERLSYFSNAKMIVPSNEIIEFKEALIFAFLGVLKDEDKVNCLQSVTGAIKDHSSGVIFHP